VSELVRKPGGDPHDHADAHGHDHAGTDAHDHATGHGNGHGHAHQTGVRGLVAGLFSRHSHDSADSVDDALESSIQGIRAVKISLAGLLATSGLQVLVLVVSGSVALLADTIHNFSDALTAVPLWIAFILGRRAATRRYTYGYRRAEDLAGLFIVGMIALSALLAGWESIQRLISPQPISHLQLVMLAGVIGFLGNELVATYRIRVGRQIGSAALIADGLHARTDGFTSLAVVVGALGVAAGFPQADPLVGLLITIAILWVLRDAVRSVFARLMDAVDPGLVDDIERIAGGIDSVQRIESVRVRWIGHRLEVSLHAVVDSELTVAGGHWIAESIRHALFHDLKNLDSVLVHVDPGEHDFDHHATTRDHETGPQGAPSVAQPAAGTKRH
jgi:cation diffusion facilitator family transporter